MSTTKNTQESPPVRDRSTARQQIREHLEKEAHKNGYTSHAAEAEAEYQQWQTGAGMHRP